jgi:hypothetical protein
MDEEGVGPYRLPRFGRETLMRSLFRRCLGPIIPVILVRSVAKVTAKAFALLYCTFPVIRMMPNFYPTIIADHRYVPRKN